VSSEQLAVLPQLGDHEQTSAAWQADGLEKLVQ
jgi:hypothetical protein